MKTIKENISIEELDTYILSEDFVFESLDPKKLFDKIDKLSDESKAKLKKISTTLAQNELDTIMSLLKKNQYENI